MTWVPAGPAWLFCPADRPERYAKAAAVSDVVILDLEDGVAPGDKVAARRALIATPLDPDRTVVRLNAAGTEEHRLDLEALDATTYRRILLSKTEAREPVARLAPREVVILIESARGAALIGETVGAPNVIGVMWGAEDLIASMGGTSSRFRDGSYRDVVRHVRSAALLMAKAHGQLAIDSVYLDIPDLDGLRAETEDAVSVGFDVKVAIHPSQVAVIRAAYIPSAAEQAWARRVLAAAESERGAFAFEGRMVDAPVLRHAETIRRRSTPTL